MTRGRLILYGMNYAPEPTGVGRYSGELGAYLASIGGQVEAVTTAPHYPGWAVKSPYGKFKYITEWVSGVRVVRCPMLMRTDMRGLWRVLAPFSFALLSAPAALWRMVRMRPHTVLAVEPTLFVGAVALVGARLVGAKAMLHVQDLEIDAAFAVGHLSGGLLRRLALWYERMLLTRFDRVITISNEMKGRLQAKGVSQSRLEIVRNWVDLQKIVPLAGPNHFREKLQLPEGTFVALYAGNIGAKQALHIVLNAAERLVGLAGIVFVIAGDGPEKPALQARYGKLPNVRFMPLQPENLLCELLNLADVHLLPQDRSAADLVLPSKLGGMLASGRAILAMAEEGSELHNFLAGWATIIPSGDSARMAQEILVLARSGIVRPLEPYPIVQALDSRTNLARFAALLGLGPQGEKLAFPAEAGPVDGSEALL